MQHIALIGGTFQIGWEFTSAGVLKKFLEIQKLFYFVFMQFLYDGCHYLAVSHWPLPLSTAMKITNYSELENNTSQQHSTNNVSGFMTNQTRFSDVDSFQHLPKCTPERAPELETSLHVPHCIIKAISTNRMNHVLISLSKRFKFYKIIHQFCFIQIRAV